MIRKEAEYAYPRGRCVRMCNARYGDLSGIVIGYQDTGLLGTQVIVKSEDGRLWRFSPDVVDSLDAVIVATSS